MQKKLIRVFLALILLFAFSVVVHAGTISDPGWSDQTSGSGSASRNNGTISLSAEGYKLIFSTYTRNASITLTNGTGVKQVLEGEMQFGGSGTFGSYTITLPDGSTVKGDKAGTYSEKITMEPNQTLTISVTSASGSGNTITCTYTPVVTASVTKTITCSTASNGTYTVNDETNGSVSFEIGDTLTLEANPTSGYVCLGFWVDESTLLPMNSTGSMTWVPTDSHTITPIFAQLSDTSAPFSVNGKNYYTWETAFAAAGNNGTVVLAKDYSLPTTYAGNGMTGAGANVTGTDNALVYRINAGQKLLIPYDSGFSATFGTTPATLDITSNLPGYKETTLTGSTKGTQYAYRTLTVGSNTTITCNGAISVNSAVIASTSTHSGIPVGPYGHINLSTNNSKLIIASADTTDTLAANDTAGVMYCYGYITGEGKVEVQSGASLYEAFQALGWRGGFMVKSWLSQAGITSSDVSLNSFLFSDYAVQNVEADLLVRTGATCNVIFTLDTSKSDPKTFTTAYIGSSTGLIQLGSTGNVLREYDAVNNQMQYTLNGTVVIANIDILIDFSNEPYAVQAIVSAQFGTTKFTLNTANHIFGISSGSHYVVDSGSTVNLLYSYKLLPETSITVKGAGTDIFGNERGVGTLNLSGTLYLYDAADYLGKSFAFYRGEPVETVGAYYGHWDSIPVSFIATTLKSNFRGLAGAEFLTEIPPLDQQTDVASAQLIVNGALNVTGDGAIYTSNDGGTSPDKVISGTGIFTHTGKNNTSILDEMNGWYDGSDFGVDPVQIDTASVIGLLAGVSTDKNDVNDSFPIGTTDSPAVYYGRPNNFWYQYVINTNGVGTIEVVGDNGTAGKALSPLDTRTASISNIVGCVANNGTFAFKVSEDVCSVAVSSGTLTHDETTGVYTISSISADTTIALTAHTISGHTCTGCGETTTCTDTDGDLACDLMLNDNECNKPMTRLYSMNANADARTELVLKFYVHEELKNSLVTTVDFGSSASAEAIISGLTFDNESGFYVLTVTQPVASGEMTLPVTVSFTDGTSAVYTVVSAFTGVSKTSVSRSVADYAKAVLQNDTASDKAKDLVTKLVTYGGYAQKFFHEAGYEVNVDDLAYDILESIPSVAGVDASNILQVLNVPEAFASITQVAHLEAAIWQDVYFVLADGYAFVTNGEGEINLTLSYKESVNGETKYGTLIPKVDEKGRYYVRINNIPAAFLDYSYKITGQVTKDGVVTPFEVQPSITAYLGRLLVRSTDENQRNLAKAMWLYNQAANVFFNEAEEMEVSI